jgi:hypothetical protein
MVDDHKGKADFLTVLLSAPLMEALERYITEKEPGLTRSDALKKAFEEWCVYRGYIGKVD